METATGGANPVLWVWFKLSWNRPDKGWLVARLYEELEDGGDTIRCVEKTGVLRQICRWGHAVYLNRKSKGRK